MKLKVQKRSFRNAFFVMLSVIGTTSCIDNKYDLDKDIDLTVSVGGEHLAFPIGNTEKILLSKIIKTEDSDMLLVDEESRTYYLSKTDKMNGTQTTVSAVTIDETNINFKDFELTPANKRGIINSQNIELTAPEQTSNVTIQASNIDKAVKKVIILKKSENRPCQLVINIDIKQAGIQSGELNLSIPLPEYLKIKEQDLTQEGVAFENGILYLTRNFTQASSLQWSFELEAYDFSKEKGGGLDVEFDNNETGRINFTDELTVNSSASVVPKETGEIALHIQPSVLLTAMPVKTMHGVIDPDLEVDPTLVKLDGLPDFLNDEEVELDIKNPTFTIEVNNPLNGYIDSDIYLTGWKNGKQISSVEIKQDEFHLKPNQNNKIVISRETTTIEGATDNIVKPELNDLIKVIPDEIKVEMLPQVRQEPIELELDEEYSIQDCKYDINMPLVFGENLTIVYNDSISDLGGNLDDIDFSKANILITAENTIPLNLEIKKDNVILKDQYGKVIKGILTEVEGQIKGSADGLESTTSNLTIKLTETEKGAIRQLDRLCFKVTAVSEETPNVPLKDTQWLQLSDMKLNIPNGIKIDLN